MVNTLADLMLRALQAAAKPASSLSVVRDALEGLGEIIWAGLNPAPRTPLNVEIGPHRRYAVSRQQLSDYKEVKNVFGGTVNDVVLTVVSGALARWLRSRGVRTEGLEMRALVPVSVRTKDEHGTLGNRLTVMRGPLPIYIEDPVARLRTVREAMDGLKESKQAVGAATMAAVTNLAPPTVLAQASRLQFSTRLFNLIVTNIPGPQLPLYVLGRELQDLFPVAFLPKDQALAIAIMSYNGGIDFGLLADYDALPDVEEIAEWLDDALQELLVAARSRAAADTAAPALKANGGAARRRGRAAASANGNGTPAAEAPAPIVPTAAARPKHGPAADMRARQRSRSRSGSGPGSRKPPRQG
jgi:WS/DGAT/MGAT family acyltransferase